MTLPIFQRTITDEAGNAIPNASIEVRLESTNALVSLYSDRAGLSPISNPFTTSDDGFAQFYVEPGDYRIKATDPSTGNVIEWRDQPIFGAGDVWISKYTTDQLSSATALRAGNLVRTPGYYAAGDGGGNDFIVEERDGSTEDGGSIIFIAGTSLQVRGLFPEGSVTTAQLGGDAADLQKSVDLASSLGLYECIVTESNDFSGTTITVPSKVSLRCKSSDVVLTRCRIFSEGSHGSEIALTTALNPGERVFSVSSAAGLTAGQDLKIVSALNCGSSDAGTLRLGDRPEDNSHFSEFVVIESISGNEITLVDPVLWSYPLSGGAESINLSNSAVIPVALNDQVSIDVNSTWEEATSAVFLNLCKRSSITSRVTSELSGSAVMQYCKDSIIGEGVYTNTSVGSTNSSTNPVKIISSQSCRLEGLAEVNGGHQGFDVTYAVNDDTLYGGPSMFCKSIGAVFSGQTTDCATSHPGCFATEFYKNTGYCKERGIRIRSKMDFVHGNFMYGSGLGSSAYTVNSGLVQGSKIVDNFALNFENVVLQEEAPLYDLSAAVEVARNTGVGCNYGYRTNSNIGVHSLLFGSVVEDNKWIASADHQNFLRGVTLNSYSNGITVRRNKSYGASENGVSIGTNIINLEVFDNSSYDQGVSCSGVSMASNLAFITDTVTFPGGNADANLVIRGNKTDGTGSQYGNIIRNADCYREISESGWQQLLLPIASGIASNLERSSINIYVDHTASPRELRARFNDGDANYDVLLSTYGP